MEIIVQSEFRVPDWKWSGKDHVQGKVSVSLCSRPDTPPISWTWKFSWDWGCVCAGSTSPLQGGMDLIVYIFSHLKLTKREKLPIREAWQYWKIDVSVKKVDVSVKKMKWDQHEGMIPGKVKVISSTPGRLLSGYKTRWWLGVSEESWVTRGNALFFTVLIFVH